MQKIITGFIVIGFCLLGSGCTTTSKMHYDEDLFKYKVTPVHPAKKINKVVGLNELLDKRPEVEQNNLPPEGQLWDSVPQRITSLLVKDFQTCGLFKEVHSPAQVQDDIVIDGSINRFFWNGYEKTGFEKAYESWWSFFFPPVSISMLLGAPCSREYCIIDIALEAKDNKTGKVIATFSESSKAVQSFGLYSDGLAGQDVKQAFSQVVEKLKKDLLAKLQ